MIQELTNNTCVRWACWLEAWARKFGNVHRHHDFPKLTYQDLMKSAAAIGPEMERAPNQSIGVTILRSIEATRRVVNTNTNLGIVLLLAPLAGATSPLSWLCGRGAGGEGFFDASPTEALTPHPSPAKPGEGDQIDDYWLKLLEKLNHTTVEDARLVYRAIRLAQPGGMKPVPDQDVSQEPSMTLKDVMTLAADRDFIACQYVNGFADVRAGAQFLKTKHGGQSCAGISDHWEQLIVDLQLWFLARHPDSLVARKRGIEEALELQKRALALTQASEELRESHIAELNDWFGATFPQRNPGTTADLVCASLFVALRTGIIPLPEIPESDLKLP